MYYMIEEKDKIRIPLNRLGEELDKVIEEITRENLEGKIKNNMLTILVKDVEKISKGKLVYGIGELYQDVKYTAIVFKPELQEVVEGVVCDVIEHGAFVNIGGLDGLLHISQIVDDKIYFDKGNKRLVCKKSKRDIKIDDKVRVRIVSLSLNPVLPRASKIGLTMRQPGLGKIDWLKEKEGKKNKGKG